MGKGSTVGKKASQAVDWGGGNGGGASVTLTLFLTPTLFASLTNFVFFFVLLPQCGACSKARQFKPNPSTAVSLFTNIQTGA